LIDIVAADGGLNKYNIRQPSATSDHDEIDERIVLFGDVHSHTGTRYLVDYVVPGVMRYNTGTGSRIPGVPGTWYLVPGTILGIP
jgi:hypothetical protein